MFQNDPVGEMDRVGNFRTPEPAVNRRVFGERLVEIPLPDAGTSDKQMGVFRRWIPCILLFELLNDRFPAFERVLLVIVITGPRPNSPTTTTSVVSSRPR